jgi:hypothetical protein
LYERIRRIVCTTEDEATAHVEIEDAIVEATRELNVPALVVDQTWTNRPLKLPLPDRIKKLRELGHQM